MGITIFCTNSDCGATLCNTDPIARWNRRAGTVTGFSEPVTSQEIDQHLQCGELSEAVSKLKDECVRRSFDPESA